ARRRRGAAAAAEADVATALPRRDARQLPAAQRAPGEALPLTEERQVVNVTDGDHVTAVGNRVALVQNCVAGYALVGCLQIEVVQSLAPGVGNAGGEASREPLLPARLQRIVTRHAGVFLQLDRAVAQVLPNRVDVGVDERTVRAPLQRDLGQDV